jgi:pilus assembly protein CpaF
MMAADGLPGRVRELLLADGGAVTTARVAAAVRSCGAVLGDVALDELVVRLRSDLTGLGPLDHLLDDPDVTDVLVNGPTGTWVDRGHGVERVAIDVGSEAQVRALAVRLAAAAGRRLDAAAPFVDARLPGGIRLHAVLPPLAAGGTHLSLRVASRRRLGLGDVVQRGGLPPTWLPLVTALVATRCSFLVTGGTGSGKTTLLGALLGLVPPDERLVLVEDCSELVVEHPHVVRLEARPANVEGRGAITLTDLVRQALRMRPDRLVVGEVRGAEVRELLAALNTGHDGGCGTLHANAATEVPARLEALGALAGLSREAVHSQAAGAVRAVIHLRRVAGRRRVVEVAAVCRERGLVVVLPARVADLADPAAPGRVGPGLDLLNEWVSLRPAVSQ